VAVTIGGGDGAGDVVIGSYLEMLRRFESEILFESLILPGPFLSPKLLRKFQEEIRDLPAKLLEFVPSTSPYLSRADLAISTGGYNTLTQTMAYGHRALVIPRVMHRKEQLIRARRFEEMGLVKCLHPDEVTPVSLFATVTTMLASPSRPIAEAREAELIPLDGTERLVDFCSRLSIGRPRI
jgi:predicted glycosyltransferase